VNIQKLIGYNQTDLLQKILYKPNENTSHLLNVQISNSSNINRYDRLTETSNGLPVYSEWYYGPQVRNMIGYKLTKSNLNGYFQKLTTNVNYQHLEESRMTRRFKSNNKDYRFEAVDMVGLNMDLLHQGKSSELNIGVESYYNNVGSTAYSNNIATNVRSAIATRYSDGPTNMANYALYAQHTQFLKGNWVLNTGLRLNNVHLNANFKDTALMHFPFTNANQNNTALTGNLGMAYNGADGFRVAFGFSSGFRAPNVDYLTKVFYKIRNEYEDFISFIHTLYMNIYVFKLDMINTDVYYKKWCKKIHEELFVPAISKIIPAKVTRKIVKEYFDKYEPRELLYIINFEFR
jgi:hemoglobin/transferrin/lactoferrin receptor protein